MRDNNSFKYVAMRCILSIFFFFSFLTISFAQQPPVEEEIQVDGVSIIMIKVEGSTFQRHCTIDKDSVYQTIALDDFYLAKFEVTQELWDAVLGENPSYYNYRTDMLKKYFRMDADTSYFSSQQPVDHVTWFSAQVFIDSLNKLTGRKFRMPTAAEWEYAARGGKYSECSRYSGGDNIDLVAWHRGNADWSHKVGRKHPNILGIHDMTGNIAEWCSDWYADLKSVKFIKNPKGPKTGDEKVLKGGSWGSYDRREYNVNFRVRKAPGYKDGETGLRLALDIE